VRSQCPAVGFVFDASDIDALLLMNDGSEYVWRFTPDSLRREIHAADVGSSVARFFGEDDWADTCVELASAMRLALEIVLWLGSPPKAVERKRESRGWVDVAKVKAGVDIVELARKYTVLKKSGRSYFGKCPIHADMRTPSFYVYPETQSWYCFGACATGGDVLDLLMRVEHLTFRQAAEALA
jgi:hypothetical protein